MTTSRALIRSLLIASLLALPLASQAQPGAEPCDGNPPPGHGHNHGGPGMPPPGGPIGGPVGAPFSTPLPPHLHGLQLSEAQQDKIFSLVHAQAPKLRELAKTARKSRDELHALAESAAFDDTKARSLAETGARADAESALILARLDQQTLKLLTPEQRKQVEERKAMHRGPEAAR